jgi:TolB protein
VLLAGCVLAFAACGDDGGDEGDDITPGATTAATAPSTAAPSETPAASGDHGIVYEAVSGGFTNVWHIDPASGATTQLTDSGGYSGAPAWAPDHSHIIFASDRDGSGSRNDDVYLMAPDGSDVRRLTSTPDVDERHPKYAPDGSVIAFVSKRESEYRLAIMDVDGGNAREVTGPYQFVEFPAWRRDGSEIWFAAVGEGTNAADILSYDMTTGEIRTRISTPGADVCPHFLHDGTSMTYATATRGVADAEQDIYEHDLASDDASGASDTPLTEHPARDDYANPSPDDTQFVFLTARDGNFDLYLMDRDGSNQRPLTQTPSIRENVPDW